MIMKSTENSNIRFNKVISAVLTYLYKNEVKPVKKQTSFVSVRLSVLEKRKAIALSILIAQRLISKN